MSTQELARAQQSQHDKATLQAKLKGKKPLESSYNVVLDPAPVEAWEQAKKQLQRDLVYEGTPDEDAAAIAKARAELDQAELAMLDAVATFHLRGVPHHTFEQLKTEHPPTDEMRAAGDEWDALSVRPHLIAACLFDPDSGEFTGWTAEEVVALAADWNDGEYEALYNVALLVNLNLRTVNLPKGSGSTRS